MIKVYLYGKLKGALSTEHYNIKKGTWVLLDLTLGYDDFTLIATDDFTQSTHTSQNVPINLCSYHDSVDHNIDLEDIKIFDKRSGIEYVIDEFVNDSYFDINCESTYNTEDDDAWEDDIEEATEDEAVDYDIFFETIYDKYIKDQLSFDQAARALNMSRDQFRTAAENFAAQKLNKSIRDYKRSQYGEEE